MGDILAIRDEDCNFELCPTNSSEETEIEGKVGQSGARLDKLGQRWARLGKVGMLGETVSFEAPMN